MQHAPLVEGVEVLARQAVGAADFSRRVRDPLGVLDRVAIPSFDRARQREDHALRCVKALVQRPIAQQHLCPNEELLRVERLREEVIGARGEPFQPDCAVVRCGDEDDGNETAERVCFYACAQREAVHSRHIDIGQDEVRLVRVDLFERLLAVSGMAHLIAEVVKVALEQLTVRAHVVHDEDDRFRRGYEDVRQGRLAGIVASQPETATLELSSTLLEMPILRRDRSATT